MATATEQFGGQQKQKELMSKKREYFEKENRKCLNPKSQPSKVEKGQNFGVDSVRGLFAGVDLEESNQLVRQWQVSHS